MFFADDLLARMVFNAAGGSEEDYTWLVQEVAQAVRDFMKFTAAALDQLFVERLGERQPPGPDRTGCAPIRAPDPHPAPSIRARHPNVEALSFAVAL
jgi:hypothetical protein